MINQSEFNGLQQQTSDSTNTSNRGYLEYERKRRQKRTVFSGYQKLELEKAFEMSHYPSQIHMKTLSMYLNLKIETVKVLHKCHCLASSKS